MLSALLVFPLIRPFFSLSGVIYESLLKKSSEAEVRGQERAVNQTALYFFEVLGKKRECEWHESPTVSEGTSGVQG